MNSSKALIFLGIIGLSLFASPLLPANEARSLTLAVDGGKQVDFASYYWGDNSTGIPGEHAVRNGDIHSITVKRRPDHMTAFLTAANSDKRAIPSATLQIPASGSAAAATVTMHNVSVVNVQAGGGTTDKAEATEWVKLGFESLEVTAP